MQEAEDLTGAKIAVAAVRAAQGHLTLMDAGFDTLLEITDEPRAAASAPPPSG